MLIELELNLEINGNTLTTIHTITVGGYDGMIWLMRKEWEIRISMLQVEEKFIHVKVLGLDKKVQYNATVVYSLNQSERIKALLEKINSLGNNLNTP